MADHVPTSPWMQQDYTVANNCNLVAAQYANPIYLKPTPPVAVRVLSIHQIRKAEALLLLNGVKSVAVIEDVAPGLIATDHLPARWDHLLELLMPEQVHLLETDNVDACIHHVFHELGQLLSEGLSSASRRVRGIGKSANVERRQDTI